jgi:hypothetical protein
MPCTFPTKSRLFAQSGARGHARKTPAKPVGTMRSAGVRERRGSSDAYLEAAIFNRFFSPFPFEKTMAAAQKSLSPAHRRAKK